MNIQEVRLDSLRPADWRTTYVLRPDMQLLKASMLDAGWLAPILVRSADSTIIDGFHRWVVAQDKKFLKKFGSLIPVIFVDVDELNAMVLHVRMNRARGQVVAKFFSNLLRDLVRSGKYDENDLAELLVMSPDEIDLMLDGSIIKRRNIKEHTYSNAWIPIEAPPAEEALRISIERPLTPDR